METIKEIYEAGFSCVSAMSLMTYFKLKDETEMAPEQFLSLCDLEIQRKYNMRTSRFRKDQISLAKMQVASWFDAHTYMINTWYKTEHFDYDPIENYSSTIHEEIKNNNNGSKTNSENGSSNGSKMNNESRNSTNTTNSAEKNNNTIVSTVPFDAGFRQKEQTNEVIGGYIDTDSIAGSSNAEETIENSHTVSATQIESEEGKTVRDYTQSGNIGVTTSQQMIQSEREVAIFSVIDCVAYYLIDVIASAVYGGI